MPKKTEEPTLVWDTCANARQGAEWRLERVIGRYGDTERYTDDFPALIGWETSEADPTRENLIAHLDARHSNIGLLEDYLFEDACGDQDEDEDNWECLCEALTDWMQEVWPKPSRKKWPFGYWRAEGSNLGWQHRSGYKTFEAESGQDLLRAILPDTQCSFTITRKKHRDGGEICIVNSHHDASGEVYAIYPRNANGD